MPGTPALRAYAARLAARCDAIEAGGVDRREDNMLCVTTDGRRASVFNGPPGEWSGRTKLHACAERVFAELCAGDSVRGAQLVFLDYWVPGSADGVCEKLWSLLASCGVPPRLLVHSGEARTDRQRRALHRSLRSGEVRVCVGSRQVMGLGVNVQVRGWATHHLDCPWRADQLGQSSARLSRPGNVLGAPREFVYVTEGSYDSAMWAIVERKASALALFSRGEAALLAEAGPGEVAVTAEIARAVALGDDAPVRAMIESTRARMAEARARLRRERLAAARSDAARLPGEAAGHRARAAALRACVGLSGGSGAEALRALAEGRGSAPWRGLVVSASGGSATLSGPLGEVARAPLGREPRAVLAELGAALEPSRLRRSAEEADAAAEAAESALESALRTITENDGGSDEGAP